VELFEIPSDEEIHDNMVAYWVPSRLPCRKPLSFSYLLSPMPKRRTGRRWPVLRTRNGIRPWATTKGVFAAGARRMVVDFAGGDLNGLDGAQRSSGRERRNARLRR